MEGMTHSVTLLGHATPLRDDEGRTTTTLVATAVTGVRAAMVGFRDAQIAAARGMICDAVVAWPNPVWDVVPVQLDNHVIIPDALGAPLAGRYSVIAVRQTPLHRRVMLRKIETP